MEPLKQKPAPFPIYQMMEQWAAHAFGTPEVRAHHHALYYALLNLVKTKSGLTRFALAYNYGMECSGIGSKATYLTALKELEEWGFITYTPGHNRFVMPIIEVAIVASIGPLLDLYRASIATATSTAIATSTGRNKEVIGLREEVERLKVENKAIVAAASAAALLTQKKIAELEAQLLVSLSTQSPTPEAPHTRPPADVPTRKARPHAYDPADIHPGLVLPFNTDEFRTLWAGYRQYREENKLPRFNGGMQEQEALRHLGNLALDLHTAQLIISQTIRNGWKNLFKLDEPRPQHSAQNGAAGHGFARPATVHGNPFGIASAQSLAIARAVVMGGADPHFGLDL